MEPKIDLDNYIKFDDLKDDHMGGCEFGPASIDTIGRHG